MLPVHVKIAVVMNVASGPGGEPAHEREQQIREAFAAAGATPEIHHVRPANLEACVAKLARDIDVIVAAGGDGTVSAIAGALAATKTRLGVLPLGTLNHFARDIGMPLDMTRAAAVIVAGHTKRVDVGEVNGRVFINNSSVGLYPDAVLDRDQQQDSGRSKWIAMGIAAIRVIRRFALLEASILFPDRSMVCSTPLIFIGNNAYTVNVMQLGERAHLDRGELSLYMVRSKGRLRMFWMMVRAILGRVHAVEDFEVVITTEVVVRLRDRHLQVAVDGEVTHMQSPLRYRIRPAALAVIVPAPKEAA